jgi:hypothetical protein
VPCIEIFSVYIHFQHQGGVMRSLIITFLAEESNELNSAVADILLPNTAFDCQIN